jgi:uncharacterized protein YoxC
MTELNDTLLTVILILGSLVLIVLTVVLLKVADSLKHMETEVARLTNEVMPLIERLSGVSAQAELMLNDLAQQKDAIETSVLRIRDMADSVYYSFQSLYVEVAPTVDTLAAFLRNARRGINTFLATWKGGR